MLRLVPTVIRKKRKPARVADLQQHRSGPRLAVGIDRPKDHPVRLEDLRFERLTQPALELLDGIGAQLRTSQTALRIVLAKSGKLFGGKHEQTWNIQHPTFNIQHPTKLFGEITASTDRIGIVASVLGRIHSRSSV